MMKKILTVLVLLLVLFGCNENVILKETVKIPDSIWFKSNVLHYGFEIADTSVTYTVSVKVSHAVYFQYQNLNVKIDMINPEGESSLIPVSIPLRDKEGKFQGKGSGDYWDFESPIFAKFKFPTPGSYNFKIYNDMPGDKTPAVMALRLMVEKEV